MRLISESITLRGMVQNDDARSEPGTLNTLLRFSEGNIHIAGERLFLLHSAAYASLRKEMLEFAGFEATKGILTRAGFSSGASDARAIRRLHPQMALQEAFEIGLQLHGLHGMVRAESVDLHISLEEGQFFGEFLWHESLEADAHILECGVASEPCCWMQTGYASGFASTFMGQQVLFKEVQCKATGAEFCQLVARRVEDWDEPASDLQVYRADLGKDGHASGETSSENSSVAAPFRNQEALTPPAPPVSAEVVGASSAFAATVHKVRQVATTGVSVLFLGETGVGKERFARLLHELSDRSQGPFIALNCAAIPDSLMESELFGVEPGAFTDAQRSRRGRFERADGGTIFLDEVGLLSQGAQAKLLRVLQEREIERVGGESTISVDVRVVAATNLALEKEVAERRFRADLYYRLNVFPILIPPLRQRRDDIPALCGFFLNRYCRQHGKRITGLTERSLNTLLDYEFPGNVRELENMIERGVILAVDDQPLDVSHLLLPPGRIKTRFGLSADGQLRRVAASSESSIDPVDTLIDRALDAELSYEIVEQRVLERAVQRCKGNLAAAARSLGMTRRQLDYRLKHKAKSPSETT